MPCLPDPQKGRPFITRFPEVSSKLLYEEASGLKAFISHTHSLLGRTEIYSPRAYLPRQGKELTAVVRSPPRPVPSPPSQSQSLTRGRPSPPPGQGTPDPSVHTNDPSGGVSFSAASAPVLTQPFYD